MTLDVETLIEIQESHFESAKRILLEGRHLNPWAFIIGRRAGFAQWKPPEGVKLLGFDGKGRRAKLKGEGDGELVIDMAPTYATLLAYLRSMYADDPKFEAFTRTAQALGSRLEIPPAERDMRIVKCYMQAFDCEEKDITSGMVRYVAKTVGAVAVIHVSEAWTLEGVEDRSSAPRNLQDDPRSGETLFAVLNTRTMTRMVTAKLFRSAPKPGKARDSGKVEGFAETRTADDRGGERMAGRMVDFLEPVNA